MPVQPVFGVLTPNQAPAPAFALPWPRPAAIGNADINNIGLLYNVPLVAAAVLSAVLACHPAHGQRLSAEGASRTRADEQGPSEAMAGPAAVYRQFNRFCAQHFGAEQEDAMYVMFGKDLEVEKEGVWQHVSETSACVAWQTNLPARCYVEYGTSTDYGERTAEPERYFSLHLRYLTPLMPQTTYHYRLVSIDERGNKVVGQDRSFTTRRAAGTVKVPEDLAGPPYVLDKPDTTYLLTRDVTADATALNITADGVTLDLGAHTLVYDEKAGAADPTANERLFGWHASQNPCGIRTADRRRGLRIVNGTVRQGKAGSAARPYGYYPLFLRRASRTEIAGLTVIYFGEQVTGMMVDSDNAADEVHVHHNVFVDGGVALGNRHLGLDAIRGPVGRCHHNLIKRTRHRGLTTGSNCELYCNEVYVDSYATNSYGIMYYNNRGAQDLRLHHNRIFGTGYHPIGIGSGQGYSNVRVYANYIQMQGTERQDRWKGGAGGGDDPHQLHPVNGIRLQRPVENIVHEDNVIVVKGSGDGCMMRGLWLMPERRTGPGIAFRNNTVKLLAQDDRAEGYAIACGGEAEKVYTVPVTLVGNTVISNLVHVQFGDNYGHGGLYHFTANRFVKAGSDPRYKTIRMGWQGWKYPSFGHLFVDTRFEGGAGFDSTSFDGARGARYDFAVGWLVEIRGRPGATLSVRDKAGTTVFTGEIPQAGKLVVPLAQHLCTSNGQTASTPHVAIVSQDGKQAVREITVTHNQVVEMPL